ncbi:MAG: hypothetical protein NVS1B4_09530 [Gemmatimonadaceae bacterium]
MSHRFSTEYAVTSDRVIIVAGGLATSIKSLALRTLSDVTLNARADGWGSITLGSTAGVLSSYQGTA